MEFIWILFAFICGLAAKSMQLPSLIGYLFAGFTLHFIGYEADASLQTLARLGITLMLFTIGLKLNLKDLLKREVWLGTVSHMALWTGLLFSFGILSGIIVIFKLNLQAAAIIIFALSFSSTVCIIKILEDSGEMTTRHGRLAVGVLVIQDIAAVIFLVIATGKTPTFWAIALFALWWLKPVLIRLLSYAGHNELLPLAGFFLALGGYEVFELVGIKGDLGALITGLLLSGSKKATELSKSLLSFKDLFLIGFFLSIGFTALPTWSMLFTASTLTLLILLKFAFFFFIFSLLRLRIRTSFLAALALSNYSEFGLIVLSLCSEMKLIDKEWLVILALSISISFVITSVAYRSAHVLFTRIKQHLKRFESKLRLKEDLYLRPTNAEILVIGMGRVGKGAYQALNQLVGDKVWGMDANRDRVKAQKHRGLHVFQGDAEDPDVWEQFDLSAIKLIMLTLPSAQDSNNISVQLRHAHYSGKIAAITRYEDENAALMHVGIDQVFNFYNEAGTGFAEESIRLINSNS